MKDGAGDMVPGSAPSHRGHAAFIDPAEEAAAFAGQLRKSTAAFDVRAEAARMGMNVDEVIGRVRAVIR